MQIDNHLISRLQELARLQIKEEEIPSLKADLKAILAMFEKLGEVDTQHIKPLRHMSDVVHRLRPDIVRDELTPKQALSNAPESENQFFRVPRVLDGPEEEEEN